MNPHRLATELLIAQPGSRTLIPTPAAVLDLDAFEANVALMASRAQAAGLALRPHAKSHKCSAVARRQIAADVPEFFEVGMFGALGGLDSE